ncbi:DUF4184 family protein [Providencia stuartii]|uniref:DUF4184 family protein n=1 Tax=Providencia stuartii TaxID=588 RepID=UPI00069F8611|nr:DUF4184 family protein [Providencia stuartii]KNZ86862.1 hypothetical protein AFL46_05690 [Providencia stuartii]
MPWTFSHPAVVFPLKQSKLGRWLSLPALILGSLSPDLLYSFGLYQIAAQAHHVVGWFYTGLPICLIIYVVTYWLRVPLSKVVPFQFPQNWRWSAKNGAILIFSFFLGALTHIIWDSFTHDTGAVVRHFTFLKSNLNIMTDSQEIAIYKILQHAGSLFGALYLCYKYWQYHYRQSQENQWENIHRLKNLFVIAIISAFLAAPLAYYLVPKEPHLHINRLVYLELTLAVPFFFGLLTVFALWKQYTLITVNEK